MVISQVDVASGMSIESVLATHLSVNQDHLLHKLTQEARMENGLGEDARQVASSSTRREVITTKDNNSRINKLEIKEILRFYEFFEQYKMVNILKTHINMIV